MNKLEVYVGDFKRGAPYCDICNTAKSKERYWIGKQDASNPEQALAHLDACDAHKSSVLQVMNAKLTELAK